MSDRPRANSSKPAGESLPDQEQPAVKEHASAPHLKPHTAHNKTRDRQSSFVEESVSFVGAISFPANFHSSFAEGTEDGEGSVFDASEGLGSLGAIFSLWNTMVPAAVTLACRCCCEPEEHTAQCCDSVVAPAGGLDCAFPPIWISASRTLCWNGSRVALRWLLAFHGDNHR